MTRGKFIVLYGINNLGKTTQAKLLVEKLYSFGRRAEYLKYPVYSLDPSGSMLAEYLRQGNPYRLSAREAQIIYALNRSQYEPELLKWLEKGVDVVAEDYWGTGVAWGIGAGVDKNFLLRLNSRFCKENLALLFEGQRFASGIEGNHRHEQDADLTAKVAEAHRELGREFNWQTINANEDIEKVAAGVWSKVKEII